MLNSDLIKNIIFRSHLLFGKMLVLIFLLTSLLMAGPAFSGGLSSPFSMDSAAVLPAGVRNLRITSFSSQLESKFNAVGGIDGLASKFNRPVTYRDLIGAQPAGYEKESLQGYLESKGVNSSDIAGASSGEAFIRISGTVPVLAYGVTEKFTAAIAVPVVYSNLSVATGWESSSDLNQRLKTAGDEGKLYKIVKLQSKLQDVVATKIASLGYSPLEGKSRTDLGDIVLGSKYLAFKSEQVSIALSQRLVLPTGRVADANRVVDVAPGDGQFDLGLATVVEWAPTASFSLGFSLGYLAQISAQKDKRIPLSQEESLSADVENVREDLGDIGSMGLGLKFKPTETWTLGTQVTAMAKQRDEFSGKRFDTDRYRLMGDGSDQTLQTAQVGINYSTVALYRAKTFPVPLEISAGYTWSLQGKNTTKSDLASLDMALFF
jgi:hypothetical protein